MSQHSKNQKWQFMYNRLKKYYTKEGHTNVPKNELLKEERRNKSLPKLGRWCCNQRCLKRKGALRKDRIKQLNKIEFVWNPLSSSSSSTERKKRAFGDDDGDDGNDDDDDDNTNEGNEDHNSHDHIKKKQRYDPTTQGNKMDHYLLYYKWDIEYDKKEHKIDGGNYNHDVVDDNDSTGEDVEDETTNDEEEEEGDKNELRKSKGKDNEIEDKKVVNDKSKEYDDAVHKRGGKNYRYRSDKEKIKYVKLFMKSKYDNITQFVDSYNVGKKQNDYDFLVVNSLRNWIKKYKKEAKYK